MANTIKLKRGSGSNPGTSDLSVGEVALRTDNGTLFTKTDAGQVSEIGASSGVADGDKGDITVSNSGISWTIDAGAIDNANINASAAIAYSKLANISANRVLGRSNAGAVEATQVHTGMIADDAVTAAKLASNAVVNGSVDANAAIAGTKISPNFGSQNVLTSGTLKTTGNAVIIEGADPKILLTDTNHDSDFRILNENGVFKVFDQTNSANRLTINSSGNATFSGSVTATGGFSGSGASLTNVNATTLDSIDSGSFLRSDASDTMSGILSLTSSSQYPITINGSHDGKIVLRGSSNPYITFRESNTDKGYLQWESGGYLRLKNQEDDSSIRIKDAIDFSTDNSTWHNVWHASNDGAGSGLDADTLDGVQGASYLRSDAEDSSSAPLNINGGTANGANDATLYVTAPNNNDWGLKVNKYNNSATDYGARIDVASGAAHALTIYGNSSEVFRIRGTGTVTAGGSNTVWHAGNDGSGSGLDADTLDGVQGASYLRSDTADTISANLTSTAASTSGIIGAAYSTSYFGLKTTSQTLSSEYMIISNNTHTFISATSGHKVYIRGGGNSSTNELIVTTTGPTIGGNKVWHAGNDGSGSGLDADTLDGVQGSSFLRSDAADSATGTLTVRDVKLSAGYHLQRSDHHSGHLEGSYNNVAANDSRSNPIYSIGSNYNPTDSGLSNMYGIGYTHTNASFISFTGASGWGMYVAADGDARIYLDGSNGVISSNGQHYVGSSVVWNAGNDGSGSGLDADTLDGLNSSQFLRSDTADTIAGNLTVGTGNASYITMVDNNEGSRQIHTNSNYIGFLKQDGSWGSRCADDGSWQILGHTAWSAGNDGSGSGLDADTLDGVQASGFLRADTADTASADITFGGGAGAVNIASGSDIRFLDTTNSAWTGNPGTNAKIQGHSGYLYLVGGQNGIVFREDGTDRWYVDGAGHIIPATNNTYDIGKSSHRIKNIYTNDLHLSNEGGANSVDGTWGDWTLQEGDENIFMINNRTGKKYRMGLTEVT